MADGLTEEVRAYLASLPRTTLHDRVRYWEIRRELEEAPPQASRVRRYAPPVQDHGVSTESNGSGGSSDWFST